MNVCECCYTATHSCYYTNYKSNFNINLQFLFLGHDASENIGSPTQIMNIDDFHEQLQMKREQHVGVSFREKYYIRFKRI